MKNLKIFSIAIISASVILYSCKDKTTDPPPSDKTSGKTKQELLSDSTWKVVSLLVNGFGDVWGNSLFGVQACTKDNTYKFKLSNVLTGYDTPLKCEASDPDSVNSVYKLINDNKLYINLKLTSSMIIDDTTEIILLDANTIELKVKYSGADGIVTFKH